MKLALGTAQFGMAYGINNHRGQVPVDDVVRILHLAAQTGHQTIDTAAQYGESERTLGIALSRLEFPPDSWRIISKTSRTGALPGVRQSCRDLGIAQLDSVLVHQADDLLGPDAQGLRDELEQARSLGLVRQLGVSVYRAEQLDRILEHQAIDIVQLPLNIYDQRLLHSGHLQKLRARGVEIHVRSAFLQGLLLRPPQDLPPQLQNWRELQQGWWKHTGQQQTRALHECLGFLLSIPWVDRIVCGVDSPEHWQKLLAIEAQWLQCGLPDWRHWACWSQDDPNLLEPSRWNLHP